jgi:phage protein D
VTDVKYRLMIDGAPASSELRAAVQQIEVEDHADMADILRLRLVMAVREDGSGWTILDQDLFSRLAKIQVLVSVGGGRSEPLVDARVIETNADFSNQPGQSALEVVAMDPTVLMTLEEKIRAWSDVADSAIATTIFGEYGFSTKVEATQPTRQEVDYTTMQRGTDIRFLQQLAQRNGYECYVEVNPSSGLTEGHFHPPQLEQRPQGVLSVNMGEATNVNSFSARYDMLRPTTARAMGLDIGTQSDQSVNVESLALRELGDEPSLNGDRPRRVLLSQTGLAETGELQTYAQAVVDRAGGAITADGELNTVAYSGLLRAKRPVLVRGVGRRFNGTYYVQRVLHTFSGDGYTQRFTLLRNATGLTGQERFVADKALAQ